MVAERNLLWLWLAWPRMGAELTELPRSLSDWQSLKRKSLVRQPTPDSGLVHRPGDVESLLQLVVSPHPAAPPGVEDLRVPGRRVVGGLTVLGRLEVLRLRKQPQNLQSPNFLSFFSSPSENVSSASDVRHLLYLAR